MARLTYDDFMLLNDDYSERHEILDGDLVITKVPWMRHQGALMNLTMAIWDYLDSKRSQGVHLPYLATILGPHDIVIPDMLFVSVARRSIIHEYVWGAPDLLIEVTSDETRHRDYGIKRERYALFGVPEYWIVDTDAEFVDVFLRDGERYNDAVTVRGDAVIPSRALPHFSLTATALFDDIGPR